MIGVERIVTIVQVSDLPVALDSFSIEPRVAFVRHQPRRSWDDVDPSDAHDRRLPSTQARPRVLRFAVVSHRHRARAAHARCG